ncbi:type II toxin-antitoxin system mRNA interferase toxin, RelE/StbE family [Ochrobactrum sp. GPK 3]
MRLCDQPLKSNWIGYHDLHIEPDWLLIYKADPTNVYFERSGMHSCLFRE